MQQGLRVYLFSESTSTLNTAINALKFYYGGVLERRFIYEIKRPRKDKKLPVVLSQEEVSRFRVLQFWGRGTQIRQPQLRLQEFGLL